MLLNLRQELLPAFGLKMVLNVEFKYAFLIEAPELQEVAVFTEHCDYQLFPLYDGLKLTIGNV